MRAPNYDIGDYVTIKPLLGLEGRVVGIEAEREHWAYLVRYFHECEAKTVRLFSDEIHRL